MIREIWKLHRLDQHLKARDWWAVLDSAGDPAIREHRRAVRARLQARQALSELLDAARSEGTASQALDGARRLHAIFGDHESARRLRELEEEIERKRWEGEDARRGTVALIDPPGWPVRRAGGSGGGAPRRRLHRDQPFILRVEERGDWLVHPGAVLVVGSALGSEADLPILAALGRRHAMIERRRDGDSTVYRLIPEAGRVLSRNGRVVAGPRTLAHGDQLVLAGIVPIVFLMPVPGSPNAVLELQGDFPVHGCRRVVLAAAEGREEAIVLGPGPEAHVPLPPTSHRMELFWSEEEGAPALAVRSPQGVGEGGGPERPQIRSVELREFHAGPDRVFVDPV
jgi:hypothetical protein